MSYLYMHMLLYMNAKVSTLLLRADLCGSVNKFTRPPTCSCEFFGLVPLSPTLLVYPTPPQPLPSCWYVVLGLLDRPARLPTLYPVMVVFLPWALPCRRRLVINIIILPPPAGLGPVYIVNVTVPGGKMLSEERSVLSVVYKLPRGTLGTLCYGGNSIIFVFAHTWSST